MTKDGAPDRDDYPLVYREADSASTRYQRRFLLATALQLSGLIGAAIAGVLAVPILLVFALLVSTFARTYLLATHPERAWYESRAVAESAKTLTWRFAVRGKPFTVDGDANELFARRIANVLKLVKYAAFAGGATGSNISDWMERTRQLPLQARAETYVSGRVRAQQDWYATRAKLNETRASRLTIAVITLQLLTILGAAWGATAATAILFAGVLAAVAASLTVWLQSRQYELLASSYSLTALELGNVLETLAHVTADEGWAEAVDEAEEAISREHSTWQSSRSDSKLI